MAKKKLTLKEIKVKSVNSLMNEEQDKKTKGGHIDTNKQGHITVRWTIIETRTNLSSRKKNNKTNF